MHFMGKQGLKRSQKGLGETLTIKKHFLTFTLSVNKIIIYQFSMFKSLDSIASVVGIFMYLTISKFKQVLRSRKGLDYNTGSHRHSHILMEEPFTQEKWPCPYNNKIPGLKYEHGNELGNKPNSKTISRRSLSVAWCWYWKLTAPSHHQWTVSTTREHQCAQSWVDSPDSFFLRRDWNKESHFT